MGRLCASRGCRSTKFRMNEDGSATKCSFTTSLKLLDERTGQGINYPFGREFLGVKLNYFR